MRRLLSVMAAAAALFVPRAFAAKAPGAPTAAPVKPATAPTAATAEFEVTKVEGKIPDSLAGTWLMISSAKGTTQRYSNQWSVFTIAKRDGTWSMRQLTGNVAPELTEAIEQADKANQPLKPSDQLLQATAKSVPQLRSPSAERRAKRYTFFAPGHFPKDTEPSAVSECKLLLDTVSPVQHGTTSGNKICFTDIQPKALSGSFTITMRAMRGPVPIPISLKGSVAMFRLP
jgi:hypothetical protein